MQKLDIAQQVRNSAIYKTVAEIIKNNRLIKDREAALEGLGLEISERSCGTGGVQTVRIKKGVAYIQIGYGHGKHNYAKVVEVGQIRKSESPVTPDYFLSII